MKKHKLERIWNQESQIRDDFNSDENAYILSFDAETNGLYGVAFAISGVLVHKPTGKIVYKFLGRCPIVGEVDSWVNENVLPCMENIEETHEDYYHLLADFCKWYQNARYVYADVIVHMGNIVETKLLRDAYELGCLSMADMPYPLIDIASYSKIWDSVDNYIEHYHVEMPEGMGKDTHNPMYDAVAAAMAYRHYLGYRGCYKEYLYDTSNPCTQHAFGCGCGVYMKCTVCENALACRLRHTELHFETFENGDKIKICGEENKNE